MVLRTFLFALSALLLGADLHGQGGPPMITDDPGTPGNGHWEINIAWTDQRTPGSTVIGLPLLDANYGVGDRLQLNYQGSWNLAREARSENESGLSDSQLAVKWRFFDAGDTALQLSTYPRILFLNPNSDSDRRGTADPGTTFLLPLEARKDFGLFSANVDLGRTFSTTAGNRGWMGGLCIGREVTRGWELDLEIHESASQGLGRAETLLNAGTRWDFSPKATLLLAVGRDLRDTLAPRTSLLTFVGIQLRL